MEKTYKIRLYPNVKQKEQMMKIFGCVRFVYNYYLSEQMERYKNHNKILFYYDLSKDLTQLKTKYEWLKNAESSALQQTLRDLEKAYLTYFSEMKKPGYVRYSPEKLRHYKEIGHVPTLYDSAWHPKFKKKSSHNYSYRSQNYNHYTAILIQDNRLKLPKLGWVKIKDKRFPTSTILNATIKQCPSGKFYAYLCCKENLVNEFSKTNEYIGIDMGLFDICSLSNGVKISNPTFYKDYSARINRLHRELDRKTRGGSNWEKTRVKLAKTYEKLINKKKDYLQKLSTELVNRYDVICIEDLSIQDMIVEVDGTNKIKADKRNAILSCSWGSLRTQLEYKSNWYGKKTIRIDRWYPSSQICHVCGRKMSSLVDKTIREWDCPRCGTHHDRDINAAINILNEGLKQIK